MPLDWREGSLDRHGHELRSSERHHVSKDRPRNNCRGSLREPTFDRGAINDIPDSYFCAGPKAIGRRKQTREPNALASGRIGERGSKARGWAVENLGLTMINDHSGFVAS